MLNENPDDEGAYWWQTDDLARKIQEVEDHLENLLLAGYYSLWYHWFANNEEMEGARYDSNESETG